MTTPDIDSISTYGGAKSNFAPVEDPTTDRDAGDANKAYCSVAAMTHTSSRCFVVFTAAASTAALAIVLHDSHWGSLPLVTPTLTFVATGHFQVSWPASVVDELGVSHNVSIRQSDAHAEGGVRYQCQASPVNRNGNVVDVYVWDANGNPSNAVGVNLVVEAT